MQKLFMDKIEAEFEKGIQRGEVVPGDAKLYTRVFRGVEQQVICYNVIIDREKPDEQMIAETLRTLTEGFFVPDAFCYNIGKDLNE